MDYEKAVLDNGLPVLLIPVPGRETIGILILIGVGSRFETEDTQGFSRFFVNMCLKGTQKYPDITAFSSVLDKSGASLHSEVHQEYTAIYITTPVLHLDTSLDLLSQLVISPIFSLSELKKEKDYSQDDLKRYQTDPGNLAYDELHRLLFKNHPLGYSYLGTPVTIEKIRRDDLIAFQKKYFHSHNMLLCLSGNIKEGKKLAEKYFCSLSRGEKIPPKPFNPPDFSGQAKVVEKETPQAHFCLGIPSFSRGSEQHRQQQLLEIILGRMQTNERLLRLVGPGRFFQSLFTQIELLREMGLFLIQGTAAYEKMRNGYEAVLEELDKVCQNKIPQEELLKAKGFGKGSLTLRLESLVERCFFYGLAEMLEEKSISLKEVFEEINNITADSLQKTAQQIFNPSRYNVVFVGRRR